MLARRLLATVHDPTSAGGGANVYGIAVGVVGAVLIAIAGIGSFVWIRWKRGARSDRINFSFSVDENNAEDIAKSVAAQAGPIPESDEPVPFTFNDIQVATDGFKPGMLVRETGYSSVYRAEGPNGEQWAVKQAKGLSVQGEHLFHSEVDFLAKVSHPCILPLKGFCADDMQQILVFDYLENGALSSWLRPSNNEEASRPPLTFNQRLDIAVGVADALKYLHGFKKPTIIHRDVRSDVILLDQDMRPKLGGLGLLKHLPGEGLRLRMANRKGYLDPEYFQTYKVTPKCDVYSFGVVLLELLTGCAPFVQITRSAAYQPMPLPQWARQAVETGKVREILDPRMPTGEDECPASMVEAFATLACACVVPVRKDRPEMARVATLLSELRQMPDVASMEVTVLSRHQPGNKVVPL